MRSTPYEGLLCDDRIFLETKAILTNKKKFER